MYPSPLSVLLSHLEEAIFVLANLVSLRFDETFGLMNVWLDGLIEPASLFAFLLSFLPLL